MTDSTTFRQVTVQPNTNGEMRTLLIRKRYDATVEDVWSAVTDPDRLPRWFLPISGDLRVGGRFQFKDNAGGEILRCDAPRLVRVTWEFGEGPFSEVEVRLAPDGNGQTMLELEQSPIPRVTEMDGRQIDVILNDPAAGLWGLGTGWEMGLLGLEMHLRNALPDVSNVAESELPQQLEEIANQIGQAWATVVAASRNGLGGGTAGKS